jgi:hypothetical protein
MYSSKNMAKIAVVSGKINPSHKCHISHGLSGSGWLALLGLLLCWLPRVSYGQVLYTTGETRNGSGQLSGTYTIDANHVQLAPLGTMLPGPMAIDGADLLISYANGTVGEYDATTGALINPTFISGLSGYAQITVGGNVVYVSGSGTVGTYDASSGNGISPNFITGITGEVGAVSGTSLYIITRTKVELYNSSSGLLANSSFITGLVGGWSLALTGTDLFVGESDSTVTGVNSVENPLLTGADPSAGLSSNLSQFMGGGTVAIYNANSGALIDGTFGTDFYDPTSMGIAGNYIYIADENYNEVFRFNLNSTSNSAYLSEDGVGAPNTNYITVGPASSVPEPGAWALLAGGLGLLGAARIRSAKSGRA